MTHARPYTPHPQRRVRMTKPLRIRIDKRPTNYTDAYSCVWYVSPCERDIRGSDSIDFASYELEIHLNGMEPEGGRIKRIAHRDGDHYEVLTDGGFNSRVQYVLEYEDVDGEEAAYEWLAKRNIWPEHSMVTFGFRVDYFARMERAWRAALELFDFGFTG